MITDEEAKRQMQVFLEKDGDVCFSCGKKGGIFKKPNVDSLWKCGRCTEEHSKIWRERHTSLRINMEGVKGV